MIINDLDGYYIVFDTKNWNTELDTLINNSIRKFAAEIKTCGNPVIQALPPSEQQNGQNNNKPRKL